MTDTAIHDHAPQIRKMDVTRDLNQVADLIEMSFPIHQDPDGQIYVRNMRKTAQQMRKLDWLSPWADTSELNVSGFVWEEDNRIIGNLSLIPFQNAGRRTYLIANVAVHPTFRRKGIARALTRRALGYLRRRSAGEVWLQVREDNQDAQSLYRSVGFVDRAIRTTWRIRPNEMKSVSSMVPSGSYLRNRTTGDWPRQERYLELAYPQILRWNFQLDFGSLAPGMLQTMTNFVEGVKLHHWTYDKAGHGRGQITWQKTNTFANNLWLAFDEAEEGQILPEALRAVLQNLAKTHPLSIDYPMGRAEQVFQALGFNSFRTLIWMSCRL
jgi:ribosomal protein S18 acetylase RimI-like enzyme